MKKVLLVAAVLAAASAHGGPQPALVAPFEEAAGPPSAGPIDTLVLAELSRRGLEPSPLCSDEVFVRRVHLDVIGRLPEPDEVVRFLDDPAPDKRSALIDALLARAEYADYWAMRWCDLLRVKAEFPINLWPNAVQAYHRWVRDAVRTHMPYDDFARALLTSSGSNFRVPPVNFYRAVQSREPAALAQAAALTFLGSRIEGWPEAERAGFAAFFARVAYKRTKEWKEEIVYAARGGEALQAVLPGGEAVEIPPGEDGRRIFAAWLIRPENPVFARCAVNRMWAWLFGRGIVHEPDDLRPDNPPTNPALLEHLEEELVRSGYDLRHVLRSMLASDTYQRSSIPRSDDPAAEALFAHYIVRRLDAEVLVDALCQVTGTGEQYMSATPEPFTFVPEERSTVALADGSITSPLLEMFGRPARDTGRFGERSNEPTDGQRLHLLNSSDVRNRIQQGFALGRILPVRRWQPGDAIERVYLLVLSRRPTQAELAAIREHARTPGVRPRQVAEDLVWALLNSKEFLYRH